MSISFNPQQSINSATCYDLRSLKGTGSTGFQDDVTGHIVRLEIRTGFYEVKDKDGHPIIDQRTGRPMIRPNTWNAVFDNGAIWSWPTRFKDPVAAAVNPEAAEVEPWTGFDETIDILTEEVHVYREPGRSGGRFPRLERAVKRTTMRHAAAVQQLASAPAPAPAATPAPWEYMQ